MLHRPLGATGLSVPILAFGASPLGGTFGPITQEQADRAVGRALELGIDLFDTSPYYGLGSSEIALGRALAGVPRDRYLLATKVGRYDIACFDFSAQRTIASCEESLLRLGTDHVDLLQVHDAEFADPQQVLHETLPALERLKRAGKCRAIGITGLPLATLRFLAEGGVALDTVLSYCHGCLHDTTLDGLLPLLRQHRLGVINASPLGMGLLSGAPPPDWHPAPLALREGCAAVAAWCAARNIDLGALALQFSRGLAVDTTLVGMSTAALVERHAALAGTSADPELVRAIRALLAPVQDLTWVSGRAANHSSTEETRCASST